MKSKHTLDYPHINTVPAYIEAAGKLAHFRNTLVVAEAKLAALQAEYAKKNDPDNIKEEPSVTDKLAAAESVINGTASGQSLEDQLETQKRMVNTLTTACRLQEVVVNGVISELSAVAGRDNEEKHKALVRRMLDLHQELHEANEEEYHLRAQLDVLGYTRSHLKGMHMGWVGNPDDTNGNQAYYWAIEARDYLQMPGLEVQTKKARNK